MSTPQYVWLVTGSSSGFGRLIVERALAQGDRVVATLRKPSALADLAFDPKWRSQLLVVPLDVTSPESIASAFTQAKNVFGRVDVVVNNAGSLFMGEAESVEQDQVRSMFEVNFWGAANIGMEAVKFFRDNNLPRGGLLLNISSSIGINAEPVAAHYAASKFAMEGFFEAFAAELDPAWNIKVQIVNPGTFRTDINHGGNAHLAPIHSSYKTLSPTHHAARNRKLFAEMAAGKDFGVPKPEEFVSRLFKVVEIVQKEKDVPFYAPIGADSVATFKTKKEVYERCLDKFEMMSDGLKMPGA